MNKISHQVFYKYLDNTNTWAKSDSSFIKNLDIITKSDTSSKPIFRFEWINGSSLYSVLKYSIQSDLKNIIKVKLFKFESNNWVEVQSSPNPNVNVIFDFFKTISAEFYNQISIKENNPNFPEIDNIKAQFKDSEGTLDIDKLGAYLKTKPKALAKYCDFE